MRIILVRNRTDFYRSLDVEVLKKFPKKFDFLLHSGENGPLVTIFSFFKLEDLIFHISFVCRIFKRTVDVMISQQYFPPLCFRDLNKFLGGYHFKKIRRYGGFLTKRYYVTDIILRKFLDGKLIDQNYFNVLVKVYRGEYIRKSGDIHEKINLEELCVHRDYFECYKLLPKKYLTGMKYDQSFIWNRMLPRDSFCDSRRFYGTDGVDFSKRKYLLKYIEFLSFNEEKVDGGKIVLKCENFDVLFRMKAFRLIRVLIEKLGKKFDEGVSEEFYRALLNAYVSYENSFLKIFRFANNIRPIRVYQEFILHKRIKGIGRNLDIQILKEILVVNGKERKKLSVLHSNMFLKIFYDEKIKFNFSKFHKYCLEADEEETILSLYKPFFQLNEIILNWKYLNEESRMKEFEKSVECFDYELNIHKGNIFFHQKNKFLLDKLWKLKL